MRPLEVSVHAVAHALDPDSFLFFNVFQLLFMFGKMVAISWLVLQFLPGRRLLAFVAGVLFLVYPADSALFTFRAIHIHAAVFSYLAATCLLIRFVSHPGRHAWLSLAGAGLLLMYSLMTYQIALPPAIVTPLAALAFVRLSDRRLWIAAGAWYTAVAMPLIYAAWALRQTTTGTYETGLLSSPRAADLMNAVGLAYKWQITGWASAWRQLGLYPALHAATLAAIAVFLVTAVGVARQEWHDPVRRPLSRRRYLVVTAAGLAIVVIGMAIFLPLPSHRRDNFRIFFVSMAGSALVLSLLLFWISRIGRRFRDAVFLALAVPFVGLGYTYALQDHQFFANYSLVQQQHLQDLLAQAPGLSPGSFVVFRDHARAFVDPYVFYYGYYFDAAAKQLYGDPSISVIVCPLASDLLQTTCTFEAGGLHVTRGENDVKSDVTVPYNRVMFVENDVDDHFRLLSPEELSTAHDVPGYNPKR
jgi:hypothetical protein